MSPHEVTHGLALPTAVYPLFENAIRARRGWTLDEHRRRLGVLCSRFAAVAAENPTRGSASGGRADEIATVTPENRLIGFPYPKLMNAIIDVDQAAAVIMTSVATCARARHRAVALGVRARWCRRARSLAGERARRLRERRPPSGLSAAPRSRPPASRSTTSARSTSTAASRARCRSHATCSAFRRTTRVRSP